MSNLYDIISTFTGKTTQEVKGSAKELQLDILARLISTLTVSNGKVLRNVYVPYAKGTKTTEIDMILLANGNAYIFEVKNYNCTIVGNQNDKDWTTIYTPEKTFTMYNPIMQNKGHISTLASYLKVPENKFKSVVVFSEKADISKVKYTKTDSLCVLTMDNVVPYLLKQKLSSDDFSNDELKTLYEKIKPLTNVSKDTKEQHINDVKSKK
jgi:hypothetical protein